MYVFAGGQDKKDRIWDIRQPFAPMDVQEKSKYAYTGNGRHNRLDVLSDFHRNMCWKAASLYERNSAIQNT